MKRVVHYLDPIEGTTLPFSAAVQANEFVFVSGTPGIRKDGSYADNVSDQIHDAFRNIQGVLDLVGLDLSSIIKTTIMLTSSDYMETMNKQYRDLLGEHPLPARTTFIVAALPDPRMLVEIECVCFKEQNNTVGISSLRI